MTGSITTSMCGSFKSELAQAIHNFTASTGHVFKVALIIPSPTGTYDATIANYSTLTGNSDEVSGTGYSAGGFAWTAAQNITPQFSAAGGTSSQAYWSWSVNPSWTSASFSTGGAIIYNSSQSNKAVAVLSFSGTQTVTSGTFTIVLPTNSSSLAILRIT